MKNRNWFVTLCGRRLGFQSNRVYIDDKPYMDRFIVHCGVGCVRVHRFWRGDNDRVSHTHPWAFWTFPLTSYTEVTYKHGFPEEIRIVRAFQLQRRGADFEHRVLGRTDGLKCPFWTIVFAGGRTQQWGFYNLSGRFTPFKSED